MTRAVLLALLAVLGAIPAWGDPPPLSPADVREIHDAGDFEGLYQIARVQPRYQSSDAINRYRVGRLTPEFAGRLDALLNETAPTPGLTSWLSDFRDALGPIVRGSYSWPVLRSQMYDLHVRYDALKIPAS